VAPILLIFLRINEHTGQLLVEPNAKISGLFVFHFMVLYLPADVRICVKICAAFWHHIYFVFVLLFIDGE